MIFARPAQEFYPALDGGVTGQAGTVGVRLIRDSDDTTVIARQTTGIVESPAGSGRYVATLTAPNAAGEYSVVWDTGGGSPRTASEDLLVTSSALALAQSDDWLVSVEEARAYIFDDGTVTTKPTDAWLALVISGISSRIAAMTGRGYLPATGDPSTRSFDHDGSDSLAIDDAVEITQVRVTATPGDTDTWGDLDDDSWVAEPLEETRKYRIRFLDPLGLPASNRGWVFAGNQAGSAMSTPWPREIAAQARQYLAVEVTATWGGVPAHVKLAALMWVHSIFKRDAAFFSRDTNRATGAPGPMPPDVEAMLTDETAIESTVVAV